MWRRKRAESGGTKVAYFSRHLSLCPPSPGHAVALGSSACARHRRAPSPPPASPDLAPPRLPAGSCRASCRCAADLLWPWAQSALGSPSPSPPLSDPHRAPPSRPPSPPQASPASARPRPAPGVPIAPPCRLLPSKLPRCRRPAVAIGCTTALGSIQLRYALASYALPVQFVLQLRQKLNHELMDLNHALTSYALPAQFGLQLRQQLNHDPWVLPRHKIATF